MHPTRRMHTSTWSKWKNNYNQLVPYNPPAWAGNIPQRPSSYVELAVRPTPIHSWKLPDVPGHFEISIKRDDLTGSALSGNKVRKLEFLMADALQEKCDTILACGAAPSNCARVCAVAARQLGLHPHLILGKDGGVTVSSLGHSGNMLFNKVMGSTIILVKSFDEEGGSIEELQTQIKAYEQTLRKLGLHPYIVPLGGFSPLGTWGYIEAFGELINQGLFECFDDVILPIGTGGSLAGLAIANYFTGSRLQIHGICAYKSAPYFYEEIDLHLDEFGLRSKANEMCFPSSKDLVDIIDGYESITEKETENLLKIMTTTGICLDNFYNLKGVLGMLSEMRCNPHRFRGRRVLYLNTGGIFSLYDGRLDEMIKKLDYTNRVHDFNHIMRVQGSANHANTM